MYDIIVVGGGPAGLTAAMTAARVGKKVMILEGNTPGGQINYSPMVENYPGLCSVSGEEFSRTLTRQALEQGVEIVKGEAAFFRTQGDWFELRTDTHSYTAVSVIIATGVTNRKLELEDEDALKGRGLSYSAVQDGARFAGKPVAVVGGGDTALEYALFLSERCSKVTLVHCLGLLQGQQTLVEEIRTRNNIEVRFNTSVKALLHDEKGLTGLLLRDENSGELSELMVPGVFVAVGHKPRNEAFSALLMTDEAGYLLADANCAASLSGVYAAGDCRVKEVRQLATAVGDGAVAATGACAYVDAHQTQN